LEKPTWFTHFLTLKIGFFMNKLLFRTKAGGVSTAPGTSLHLGFVDVSKEERIRVVADERVGSGSGVNIRLTIMDGSELVAFLDVLNIAPHGQVTKVYEVPGVKLSVDLDALPSPTKAGDTVDVLIYGWEE
jgi:type III secretion protein HrpB1